MRLCAAIPCYNGAATLDGALASLLAQTRPPDEILVVDDGSTDDSRAVAARYPVRLVAHLANAGLAAARNTACAATDCDLILYLDADARADPALVATILASFSDDDLAGVGGQGIEVEIHTLADRWRALHAVQGHGRHRLESCEFLFGLCMAYRRRALQAVAGFSPLFRTNAEDVDIGFRLTAAEHRLCYEPAARVYHHRRDDERSLLHNVQAWYYWGYIARAANRRQPWRLWAGVARRGVLEPLADGLGRRDLRLARLDVKVTAAKLAALRAAAADWRAGESGRTWRSRSDDRARQA
jgi:GT2 family glycosyltransferase